MITMQAKILIATAVAAVGAIGGFEVIDNMGKVEIVSVTQATVDAKQPFQDCQNEKTTEYVKNHKDGTEGGIIGGVGGGALVGAVTHSWVGAGIGAVAGAVGGNLIDKSRQPDYIAKHGSRENCKIAYRDIKVPIGYQINYLDSNGKVAQIITASQFQAGIKVKLKELEADQVTQAKSGQIVQKAIGEDSNKS